MARLQRDDSEVAETLEEGDGISRLGWVGRRFSFAAVVS